MYKHNFLWNCDYCENLTQQKPHSMSPIYKDKYACSDCFWKCGVKELLYEEKMKLYKLNFKKN